MFVEKLRLDGKVAFVAGGGGGGNGTAVSLALAEAGAATAVLDLFPDRAEETAAEVRARGGTALSIAADVTDDLQLEAAVRKALTEFGHIDVLANVAGGGKGVVPKAGILDHTLEAWEKMQRLNLRYVFVLGKLIAKHMIERGKGGSIVNIISLASARGCPEGAAYGAAKAGLESLTMTMAVEWGPYRIRVNGVRPGAVAVPRTLAAYNMTKAQYNDRYKSAVPLGRCAEPEDIAGAVLFLASDLAAYISGTILPVEGGVLANHPFPVFNPGLVR